MGSGFQDAANSGSKGKSADAIVIVVLLYDVQFL